MYTAALYENIVAGTRLIYKAPYKFLLESGEAYFTHIKTLNITRCIGVTVAGDPFEELMRRKCDEVGLIPEKDYGFAKPVQKLFDMAKGQYLLISSVGVSVQNWHLEHAMDVMKTHNLFSVGWRIYSQENDGSYLGRLSYNTAILYSPEFIRLTEELGGFPSYVENGVLGELALKIDDLTRPIPIGGQEELAVQLRIFKHLKNKQHKLFGHIRHYGLQKVDETGLNLSPREKVLRKLMVAEVYRNREEVNPTHFLDSWLIL